MRAVLLAAGYGTRLRPITDHLPKCLVRIGEKPLLDYWLEMLTGAGVEKTLVNTHYLPEMVKNHITNSPFTSNVIIVHEHVILGTAGTLLRNKAFIASESVMLIHADNLSLFDVNAFIHAYEERGEGIDITMMTFTTDAPSTCGIVDLDQQGVVRGFYEKVENPPGNLANAAVYILSPTVIEFITSLGKEVIDFSTEILPNFIGRINTFHNGVYHRDIGTIESLEVARKEYPLVVRAIKDKHTKVDLQRSLLS